MIKRNQIYGRQNIIKLKVINFSIWYKKTEEDGRRKTEDGRRKTEARSRKPGAGSRKQER